jgi:hypothetical protein
MQILKFISVAPFPEQVNDFPRMASDLHALVLVPSVLAQRSFRALAHREQARREACCGEPQPREHLYLLLLQADRENMPRFPLLPEHLGCSEAYPATLPVLLFSPLSREDTRLSGRQVPRSDQSTIRARQATTGAVLERTCKCVLIVLAWAAYLLLNSIGPRRIVVIYILRAVV